MAVKRGGLGKGLEAIFAENATTDGARTVTLRIADIEPNRDQPRRHFDAEALAELTESIRQHGVLQPLLVRPLPAGGYRIVAGERRWRAAREAGLSEVPVVIREMSDREADELALIENLQRADLNPMEEALGYQRLMAEYGLTQEETAQVVGKSRPAVANALRLLGLPAAVSSLVADGSLSAGHARAVLAYRDETAQVRAARDAVEQGLSVREVERRAKAANTPKKSAAPAAPESNYLTEVELALRDQMGRKVKITGSEAGGYLQIPFFDKEDLGALATLLASDK